MKFLKEPCPNPSSRIAQRRPLFAAPHFNLPHPGHVVEFFVFLFHKSYCSDVGLAHSPTNFKIKRHCTSFAYRAPWGCFSLPFCFSFFFPPCLPFLFCFCSVWGVGCEIGVFKSSKHTWARKRSTVRRGTSSSHSHHPQLYGRDSCIGMGKAQDACWVAGSEPSCLNLLRSRAALTWDPGGLPLPRPQRERNGTWLVSRPRCTEKQSTGQSWPVLRRSEWWSLGKPLALWIWTRN